MNSIIIMVGIVILIIIFKKGSFLWCRGRFVGHFEGIYELSCLVIWNIGTGNFGKKYS